MEQEKEKKYSHSAAEAQEILSRRKSGSNAEELVGWIAMTGNIVKSYRDGYISDGDIANRERFLNYSFNRESMLITCLGLLEKSSDPKSREQAESLKRHLSVLRACRSNLLKDTPPRNIAKRIQKKQEERHREVTGQAKEDEKPKNNASIFANPFEKVDPKQKDTFALLGIMLIAGLDKKTLAELMAKAKEQGKKGNVDKDMRIILDAVIFMRGVGFTDKDLMALGELNINQSKDIAKLKDICTTRGLPDINLGLLYGSGNYNFAQDLKESIRRQDITSANAYDYSVTNPILYNHIEEKSREDLIAHQKELLAQKTAEHETTKPQIRISSFTVDNYYKKSNLLQR